MSIRDILIFNVSRDLAPTVTLELSDVEEDEDEDEDEGEK